MRECSDEHHLVNACSSALPPSPARNLMVVSEVNFDQSVFSVNISWTGPNQPEGKIDRFEITISSNVIQELYHTVISVSVSMIAVCVSVCLFVCLSVCLCVLTLMTCNHLQSAQEQEAMQIINQTFEHFAEFNLVEVELLNVTVGYHTSHWHCTVLYSLYIVF